MTVCLEAVPRDRETIVSSVKAAQAFPEIGLINIPDMLRFSIRSWEACGIIAGAEEASRPLVPMPHIRAIDFDHHAAFPHKEYFQNLGIEQALVIAGDPSDSIDHKEYPAETPAFIKKLKTELPNLKIYAAFDPYRTNIRYELDYLKAKEDAGAEGFMSQPFFDLRLLEIYAEYLEGNDVYWGISPVLSASSRNYWESRNRAIFPKSFRPDLSWNVEFGRRVLDFCRDKGFNLYLMPIKVDLEIYLEGLFAN